MKKYIVITASDFTYDITASNIADAKKIGRTLCRWSGEIFVSVKYVK